MAGTVLTTAFTLFNFLSYGTTAAVARAAGAGRSEHSARNAVQSLWLALVIGLRPGPRRAAGSAAARRPHGPVGGGAAPRPRCTCGSPRWASLPVMLALVGVGYLRGLQDTVTPLRIALLANLANLVLELVAIYGLGMGLAASAWATNVAQVGGGGGVLPPHRPPRPDGAGQLAARPGGAAARWW